jgi:hypothetical protein
MSDLKNDWIARLTPGASFADVGGLWGTVNEKVSVAAKAGAREFTMSDIAPQGHALWNEFDAHCARLGVSGYRKVTVDIVAPEPEKTLGVHDVVHCSGIIYHLPDPFSMLRNLKRVTRRHLIVTSMVVPERVENAAGSLDFGQDVARFVPALGPVARAVLAAHFDGLGLKIGAINTPLQEPWMFDDTTPNYGPWWWVYSPAFLRSLVETAGLAIEDECWSWDDRAYSFLLRR